MHYIPHTTNTHAFQNDVNGPQTHRDDMALYAMRAKDQDCGFLPPADSILIFSSLSRQDTRLARRKNPDPIYARNYLIKRRHGCTYTFVGEFRRCEPRDRMLSFDPSRDFGLEVAESESLPRSWIKHRPSPSNGPLHSSPPSTHSNFSFCQALVDP